jgi:hypothetical protein
MKLQVVALAGEAHEAGLEAALADQFPWPLRWATRAG